MWADKATCQNLDQNTHFLTSGYTLFSPTTLSSALCFTVCAFGQSEEQNSGVIRPSTDTDLTVDEIILNNNVRSHLSMASRGKIEKKEL